MALTEEQSGVADRLDELGLGLIAAPVVGQILHKNFGASEGALGQLGRAAGNFHEHYGPYSDLTGLALLTPTVMQGTAKKLAPEKPPAPLPETPRESTPDMSPVLRAETPTKPAPDMSPVQRLETPMAPAPKLAFILGRRVALAKFALHEHPQLSVGGYTEDEARQLYHGHGNVSEETDGLNEELEHRNITHGNDALTKKIVDAHLHEDPHYYAKLERALGKRQG